MDLLKNYNILGKPATYQRNRVTMKEIEGILNSISHRPWILPKGRWRYYQEWNNALFLHWKVPTAELTKLVPKDISVDTFNEESWISLVAFTMERIRPRNFPAVSIVSDFYEINIRTYVTKENKCGVYFLSIEAAKQISCFVAKSLSGLPYIKASIHVQKNSASYKYSSINVAKGFHFDANFTIGERISNKSELDNWLTERYALYLNIGQKVFRYETHHKAWDLNMVEISDLQTNYKIGGISLNRKPDLTHYSAGVKVVSWKRTILMSE
jgi:uncharacterized protein YqjF (DUF2071 family)